MFGALRDIARQICSPGTGVAGLGGGFNDQSWPEAAYSALDAFVDAVALASHTEDDEAYMHAALRLLLRRYRGDRARELLARPAPPRPGVVLAACDRGGAIVKIPCDDYWNMVLKHLPGYRSRRSRMRVRT